MSLCRLREHNPQELSVIGAEFGHDVPSKPGDLVKRLIDRFSFGMVIAIDPWREDGSFSTDAQRRALVLWAR